MSANLNVSYDQMNSAASRLDMGQAEIEANLENLRKLVQQLIADGFTTSNASGAFDAAYAEFNSGAVKTIQGLTGMSGFLKQAAQTLESTDQDLASRLAR